LANFCEEKIINTQLFINKQLIGVDPKLAETLVENALTKIKDIRDKGIQDAIKDIRER
jgi:hypothetical protein